MQLAFNQHSLQKNGLVYCGGREGGAEKSRMQG